MSPGRFEVRIPEAQIGDLKQRLESTRWAGDFNNEHWQFGTNGTYLRELTDYWLHDYDLLGASLNEGCAAAKRAATRYSSFGFGSRTK